MASYKVHTSVGAITGAVLVVVVVFYFLVPWYSLLVYIFIATVVGSFLPDLDSDSGMPFQVVFGLFGLTVAAVALFLSLEQFPNEMGKSILITLGSFLVVRFGLGTIFKKYTRHRGIFHSVPAAFIATSLMLIFLNVLGMDVFAKISISLALFIGYIAHLVLDEVYSTVNFNGKLFRPNKALGSALKLWSHSRVTSILAYGILGVLGYIGILGL